MSAEQLSTVRGACPSVVAPMDARDGPLVRVTIPGGIITSRQAAVLAEVAAHHGNGIIEITNRANVQLRGVAEQPGTAVQLLIDADLTTGTAEGDRARAILASPTAGVDAEELFDTRPLVRRLVAELADRQAAAQGLALEPKFAVVVDGGGAVHVRDRRGTERLVPDGLPTTACPTPIGVVSARRPGQVWVGAAPLLGRLTPTVLRTLADLTIRYGDGELRFTPWRSLIVAGVAAGEPAELLAEELQRLELTVDPADPALRVIACAGSTGCEQGLADVQSEARRLIARARARARDPRSQDDCPLPPTHLSGCDKCCASRDPVYITYIASGERTYRRPALTPKETRREGSRRVG